MGKNSGCQIHVLIFQDMSKLTACLTFTKDYLCYSNTFFVSSNKLEDGRAHISSYARA